MRLKGTFYASPLAADGKLYVFNDDGFGQIIKLEANRGSVESEREFKESVMGTPALSDGLYIRAQEHLWKIGRLEFRPRRNNPAPLRWFPHGEPI